MRRAKGILTALVAALVLALLPALGAAADPLGDGSYDVTVEDATHTVEVTDGVPTVEEIDGVSFAFEFDEETGRVLDEFTLTVDDTAYAVEVAEDGTVSTELVDGADDGDEPSGSASPSPGDPPSDEQDEDESEAEVDEASDEGIELADEDEAGSDDEADDAHGELVSTVARCAPGGRQARAAGLPDHGTFVSAAARGEVVDFEVDGESHTADLTTPEGAEAFCALAQELLDASPEVADEDEGAPGRGRGKAQQDAADDLADEDDERPTSPGRSEDAPGKQGRGKKDKGD